MAQELRLMAVHAHPDDESSKGAASVARYRAEGVDVLVVTCTGGEAGSVLNENYSGPVEDMAAVRRLEMADAASILDIQHRWLGFVDSGMDEPLPEGSFAVLPLAEVAAPLIDVMREYRPHVVTTYDENGGYPHPDHIRTHEVTMFAVEALKADWQVQKVYFHHNFSRSRIAALHEAMSSRGLHSAYDEWLHEWAVENDSFKRVTTRVECADYFGIRDAALRAHATQVDPDGDWFAVPHEIEREIWPTEDFELAMSVVDSPLPESDLFAGIREV